MRSFYEVAPTGIAPEQKVSTKRFYRNETLMTSGQVKISEVNAKIIW